MNREQFNLYLHRAVPEFTNREFHVVDLFDGNVAIVATKSGIPAVWDYEDVCKNWWNLEYLRDCEDRMKMTAEMFDSEVKNA